jgi:hypothetical protein
MTALAYFLVLIALIPFASGYFQTVSTTEPLTVTRSVVSLENFLTYRDAVMTYAEHNPSFTGTVPDASIATIFPNYIKTGPWTSQISATQIVVYSTANIGPIGASTLSNESAIASANYLYGYAAGGNWVTTSGGIIQTAPAYVPAGAILAIINH